MAKEEPQDPTPLIEEAPEAPNPVSVAASVTASVEAGSMLNIMRDKFKAEPRVRVKIKNDGPVHVQVNGYTFLIMEDVKVDVPESIADILDEAGYI